MSRWAKRVGDGRSGRESKKRPQCFLVSLSAWVRKILAPSRLVGRVALALGRFRKGHLWIRSSISYTSHVVSKFTGKIEYIKIRDTFVSDWMWLINVFGFPRQYAGQRSMTCPGHLAKTEQLANRESLCRIYGVLFLRQKCLFVRLYR